MAEIAQWPATLPQPRTDGYGLQRKASYTATDMDDGNTRTRRRFTRTPTSVTVKWQMTHYQFATFEAFFAYDVNDGAAPFSVGLVNGVGVMSVRAKFTGDPPYQASLDSGRAWFDVTATLQVRQMPTVTLDEYQVMQQYDELEVITMGDKLHNLIHTQFPGPARWN